ncbi:MAG: hypothetical protein RL398_2008, partial [Planctomycetota bacterium]
MTTTPSDTYLQAARETLHELNLKECPT